MVQLFWDASGLLKRYYSETGSQTADALFNSAPAVKMGATVLGYAETFSILLRRRNTGALDAIAFNMAASALEDEVLFDPAFDLLGTDPAAILAGISLMRKHNINASDAAILAAFLRHARSRTVGGSPCVLVASDQRLLRAASQEGLATLDPEQAAPGEVPALLAAL